MRQFIRSIVVLVLALFAGCSAGTAARVSQTAHVFANESDAHFERSSNYSVPVPLATLEVGSVVTVLSDTYGKDYWACYIRTQTSLQGWVLCTSLDYHRAAA